AVQPVIIDGATQPGGVVEIDGSLSTDFDPSGRPMSGLEITGAGGTVKGLFVTSFPFDGIVLRPSGGPAGNSVIKGNTITRNGRHGVRVTESPDNTIGGTTPEDANFITANGGNGVRIEGAQAERNKVQGNRIGVARNGDSLPNADDALAIDQAPNTIVGDPEPVSPKSSPSGASNVFIGERRGVNIEGLLTTSTQTQVNGNFFGLDTLDVKLAAGLLVNGSLFSAGGNVMTQVSGIGIQAFTQVNGSVNIRENLINIDGLAGVEAVFGPDRNILFEFKQNIVRGADRSIVAEEMGRGTFNYEFFQNQGDATDTAVSLIFRGEGTRNFDNDIWTAQLGAAFAYTSRLEPDVTMRLTLASQAMTGSEGMSGMIEGSGHIFHTVLLGNATGTLSNAHEIVVGAGFNGSVDVGVSDFVARASLEAGLFFLNRSSATPVLTVNLERTFGEDNDFGVTVGGIWKLKKSIVDCVWTGNATAGVHLTDGAEARITGCIFADNGAGLLLEGAGPSEVISNTFTGNGLALAAAGSSEGALFTRNSIFANAGPGIDLGNDGVTPNDAGDVDTGPNNLQNFPVLTSVNIGSGVTTILGTLDSSPGQAFTLEFFSDVACDPSGFGEGETFIGSAQVTTDANGSAAFQAVLPVTLSAGGVVTATASDSGGNTSEFSNCVSPSTVPNLPPVADAGPDQAAAPGNAVVLDGSASRDPDSGPSPLTFAWTQTGGPPAVLTGANTARATFTASAPGALAFTLTVSDGLAADDDDLSVIVEEEESDLILAVRELMARVVALDLPRNAERFLTAKLEAVVRSLERGRENAARNQLRAFIHRVEALREKKKLTRQESRELIKDAREIIRQLNRRCGPPRRA
ncbi:MAG: right-handed parallel beta-helix repeat-containing protein, partial [Opitutaceae bacterium]